jgi:hypothetical protein
MLEVDRAGVTGREVAERVLDGERHVERHIRHSGGGNVDQHHGGIGRRHVDRLAGTSDSVVGPCRWP